ncbi:RNA polymerase sigma factor [Microbacterium tumbae]
MSAASLPAGRALTRTRREADAADITALVEREAPGLLAYFVRRVAVREDAADLLGETLMVLWRRKDSIPVDETGARMWAYGVARRVLSGHRRGVRRRDALGERLRHELAARPAQDQDEGIVAAQALLEQLPGIDQEILRLSLWEGFSLAEVARILAMRPTTVRSRHARALAKLRASAAP